MTARRRILVVGGGPAGLSAALSLTDPVLHPHAADEVEVTVLQLGWRAGGKGATGRRGTTSKDPVSGEWTLTGDARVQEHGIHLFGNMYVNALRQLDGCLGEMQRTPGEPLTTMSSDLVPSNQLQLADYFARSWHITPQYLPHNDLVPWGPIDYPGPLTLIGETLRLVLALVDEVLGLVPDGARAEATPEHDGHGLRARLDELVRHHTVAPSAPDAERHRPVLEEMAHASRIARHRMEVTRTSSGEGDGLYARLRSVWCQIELYVTVARGVIADRIFERGIDVVDDEDFLAWCRRHGMDPVAVASSPVQMPAEMCFQFPRGDTDQAPIFSAAGFLWFVLRQILACGQATYWFARGTGDTVIAPMYRVAGQRGVRVEFFQHVRLVDFDAASGVIDRVEIDVQATTVDGSPYRPLVRLPDGTWGWPDRPIYGQLDQGVELRERQIDLESWWSDWAPVGTRTLRVGDDFDAVVLAVPLPCLPLIAPTLVEHNGWDAAVEAMPGIATFAAQVWTTASSAGLGLPSMTGTDRVCSGAAVAPFGVADMSSVLAAEHWADVPAAERPAGLYYFCGPMAHDGPWPSFAQHDVPAIHLATARATFAQWLRTAVSVFPAAGSVVEAPESFDPALLWCPPGPQPVGVARLDAQYLRANIDPNERYVPSPPGTSKLRPKAWESGAVNGAVASDWIFTGMNIGSFEGAVMSGLLAAHALTGLPALADIVGYEFARPPTSGTR